MSECCRSKFSSVIPLNMNSYDGKLMFAAIISLLLVISFVLLLHAYARWVFLLGQSAHHRRRQATLTLTTTRLHHHLQDDNTEDQMDGLDVSVIDSIPIFVYKLSSNVYKLECVICLSVFEDGETGRHLPNCSHAFHVECIDRWLQSHSSCPICRALVGGKKMSKGKSVLVSMDDVTIEDPSTLQSEFEMPSRGLNVQKSSSPPPPPPASVPPPVQGQQPLMSYSLRRLLSMSRADHKVCSSSFSSSCSNVNDLNV